MGEWLRERLGERPGWMNALLAFCAFMTFVYVPWDLFVKPIAVDEEVWFGIRFHGVLAKLLALPHWAVYAAGTVGLWRMRRWMWPWASLYAAQVAIGFLVWPVLYLGGARGWVLGVVGAAFFGAIAWALWTSRERFEHSRPGPRERYGEWALVTGASAGIGAAFARALAADGVSCVLAARREERLRELAAELESQRGVKTRVVGVDLAAPGGPEELLRAVADLEIAILVNNAGIGGAGRFDQHDPTRLRQMVELNCTTPVVLTRELLPLMRARGRGAVVMVGSVAGSQPLPGHSLYSATKSFDNLLGEALWAECRGTGVDVLSLLPGPTETEFQASAGELPHAGEPPERVVATALDALGRQPSVISGWFNWLRANAAMRLTSRSVLALAAKRVFESRLPPEKR
ncbi:MAG TPA: SDR family NAD(P)-dependent oxidoreductase [Myxococcota bacterium]|nr:SDR family NAD(P)-dependent oxidoreductase [Myxococcota bacterium]